MTEKLIQRLVALFAIRGGKSTAIKISITLLLVLPVIVVIVLGYFGSRQNLTDLTLARRESLARLGAATIKERFDRLVDLGTSLANRTLVRRLVKEGKWIEAVGYLSDISRDFSYVERIALIDTDGILRVMRPDFPGIEGVNFSSRDWYKGVSKLWKPYVSEIFKSFTNQNSIVVNVPIFNDAGGASGILNLQVVADTLYSWSKGLDVGEGGFIYFVDQHGNITGNPNASPDAPIVNGADIPYVQKALAGQSGVEVVAMTDTQRERIISYAPVPEYGWAVIVEQPNPPAFLLRDTNLRQRLVVNMVIFAILIWLMYLIGRFIQVLNRYRLQEDAFLEGIGDGVIAIDRSWNITLWNKAADALTGWSKTDALGRPLRETVKFLRESNQKENFGFIESAIVSGKTSYLDGDSVLIRKDATEMPVENSASPVFDERGSVIGAIIVFHDASEERERRRLRSDFAYASHQLRTPVTKTLWRLEAAMDKERVEDMRAEVGEAYQAAQSVNRLSEELIDVSRVDQRAVRVTKQNITIADLLADVITKGNTVAKNYNIVLVTPTSFEATTIHTDEKLCKRIITEVLDNAIKYSEPNGRVTITSEVRGGAFETIIEDSGRSIIEEERPLIFTKFFRGRNINTTSVAGAGLGLYIAQEYVKLLGGKIWFESKEKGTIFYISVPIA